MYRTFVKPLLFSLDPERVHHLALGAGSLAGLPPVRASLSALYGFEDQALEIECFGIPFKSPLGLAAGFDKNAEVLPLLEALGFGHVEVGGVVPLPQEGNPLPRIFRLKEDEALINRMGLPSIGVQGVANRLARYSGQIPIGVNVGKNRDTPLEEAVLDYKKVTTVLAPHVSWITLNVSSPNTPGLRKLQGNEYLENIIQEVKSTLPSDLPLIVKISPDLDDNELDSILDLLLALGVQGVTATNTSIKRDGLRSSHRDETGGLSGKPLFERTLQVVNKIYTRSNGGITIIGVGGMSDVNDCVALLSAGASLVRGYTGFVYNGPSWPREILQGLSSILRDNQINSVNKIVGNFNFLKENFPNYASLLSS